ncbi:MAG: hypothetical protein ACWA6X_04435 [Bauldia sp.]
MILSDLFGLGGVSEMDFRYRIGIVLLTIFAYFVVGCLIGRSRLERVAESTYFLAFLFTMVSLGTSLVQFNTMGIDIIPDFATAIVSTAFGIFLRTWLTLAIRDQGDVEETAQRGIAESLERLKREMEAAIGVFTELRNQTQQELGRSLGAMAAHAAGVLADLKKTLDDLASGGRAVSERSAEVSQGLGGVTQAAANVRQAFDQLREPGRVIEVQVQPLAASFTQMVDSLRDQIGQHGQRMEEMMRAQGTLGQQQSQAVERAFKEAAESIAGAIAQLDGNARRPTSLWRQLWPWSWP